MHVATGHLQHENSKFVLLVAHNRLSNIYQTRVTVFHRYIQTSRTDLKIRCTAEYFLDEIRGVWIANATLSQALDISSQLKHKLRSKQRSKIVKIYAN